MSGAPDFRYLNLADEWPGFRLQGVVIDEGALRLARVPATPASVGQVLGVIANLTGPAGIGVDRDGTLYVAEPGANRVVRIDACDLSSSPLPCFGGGSSEERGPGRLSEPHGVLVGPRDTLYVADTGNHRVQLVDLATGQLRGIWGQPNPWGTPTSSSDPGRFMTPWDLASDRAERWVYVSDPGVQAAGGGPWSGGRVQRFDPDGRVDRGFAERVADSLAASPDAAALGAPGSIAIALLDERDPASERLLVLDQQPPQLLIFALDGTYDADATRAWRGVTEELARAPGAEPSGVALVGGTLYVTDATNDRVLVFGSGGALVGISRIRGARAFGLALDRDGRLLVHPGGGGAVERLERLRNYVESGTFVAGPFEADEPPWVWRRLALTNHDIPDGTRLRLFTLTTDGLGVPTLDADAAAPAESPQSAALDQWHASPWSATDVLALNAAGRYLWVGGVLRGDGTDTPTLRQLRLELDREGWIQRLPALYRRDERERATLERALDLFASAFDDEMRLLEELPHRLDPRSAPAEDSPASWLDWLAGWLHFRLDDGWDEPTRRAALGEAFGLMAGRGTVDGLRRLVGLYTGARALIDEPAAGAGLWALGDGSRSTLGFETMLAAAELDGAIVGTTAVVERSHLTTDGDYGAPAYDDLAHRFTVTLFAAEVPDESVVTRVRAVLDREKPAHTTYHLCVVHARMRVGFQARLGVDAIVAGPPRELTLDGGMRLGHDAALAAPARQSPVMGRDARLGRRSALA